MGSSKNALPLQRLPIKWLVALVLLLFVYGAAQPVVNARLGLNLPSLASLLGQAGDAQDPAQPNVVAESSADAVANVSSTDTGAEVEQGLAAGDLRFGLLREIGADKYLSPVGLVYGKGSAEGTRLAHIERHLSNQPARPIHGVFYGDMPQVLRWLDDAYRKGESGEQGSTKKQEGRRTVYLSNFDKPVGYVGGQAGKRDGNPDTRTIQLILEDKNVITAYPR